MSRTARRPSKLSIVGLAIDSPEVERLKDDLRRDSTGGTRGSGRYAALYTKALDGFASVGIAESVLWANPLPPTGYDRVIESACFTGAATCVAGANHARFVLKVRRAASNAAEYAGELKSTPKSWPAFKPVEFAFNGTSPIVGPGDVVTVTLEKLGALPGVVVPAGVVELWVRDT